MAKSINTQPGPRWLYAFLTWVKRTPLGGWAFAAIVFALGVLLMHLPLWQSGRLAPYQIDPALIFPATWFPLGVLFWLWQDRIAAGVIQDFGKGIGKSETEVQRIYARFISVPDTTAWVLLSVGLLVGGFYSFQQAMLLGISNPIFIFLSSVVPTLGSTIELLGVWRWGQQLFHVNRLYREIGKINLFNLWPIYALSRYGYMLALVTILVTVAIDGAIRLDGGAGLSLFNIAYTVILALLIFIVPLLGINARLRREKQNDLQRIGAELNGVYEETEAAVRSRKLAKVPALKNAAGALKDQMDAVQKVATWPWNPGSLRNLFLPILLPLGIAILQKYVLAWLGF